jgi:hypothetical protein
LRLTKLFLMAKWVMVVQWAMASKMANSNKPLECKFDLASWLPQKSCSLSKLEDLSRQVSWYKWHQKWAKWRIFRPRTKIGATIFNTTTRRAATKKGEKFTVPAWKWPGGCVGALMTFYLSVAYNMFFLLLPLKATLCYDNSLEKSTGSSQGKLSLHPLRA